jgi:hypothetical protein
MCPVVQELFELLAFLIVERHKVLFLGHCWSSSGASVDQVVYLYAADNSIGPSIG